jgi:predicted enzyme related to lactoylglutathione lyase
VEVLSGRVIITPGDFATSRRFYEETLGLRIYREFGVDGATTGVVYFLGGGFLELSPGGSPGGDGLTLWLQVADLGAEHARLASAGVAFDEAPRTMPWGLLEARLRDPDGVRLILVEVPAEHPIRRRVD